MLQVVVTRLETRGKHPRFVKILQQDLDAMDIDAAGTVLDIGCGTGVVSRGIAGHPGFTGRITGIDLSPVLIATGARLAAEEGVAARITFRVGDTRGLDLADGAFDAVVAHTLLSHVSDPLAVAKEIARVTRPGGMIGIFDADFASITFGNADPVKGKAYDEALTAAIATSPRVMRDLPRLLRAAGSRIGGDISARDGGDRHGGFLAAGDRIVPAAGSEGRHHERSRCRSLGAGAAARFRGGHLLRGRQLLQLCGAEALDDAPTCSVVRHNFG